MSNYANTKATIAANVYSNHNNEVTAPMVKTAINSVVDTLIAGGYLYKGVAHPGDAAVTPDANVFYLATEVGTYTNKGGLQVADGEVAVLKYNGSWSKEVTGAATAAEVSALGQEVMPFGYGQSPFFLAQGPVWSSVNSSSGVFLYCEGKTTYSITSANNNCVFAFLKSNNPVAGQAPDLATGAARTVISAGGTNSGSIPSDAKYLYISTKNSSVWSPTKVILDGYDYTAGVIQNIINLQNVDVATNVRIDSLSDALGSVPVDLTNSLIAGSYYTCNVIGSVPTTTSNSSWRSCELAVRKGEVYSITGWGGNGPRLWATADSDKKVTKYCQTSGSRVTESFTIEQDGYLYVNMTNFASGDGITRTLGGLAADIAEKADKDIFRIPILDANFETPLPYKVYRNNGVTEDMSYKGNPLAQYRFTLPLQDSWNIRFKFRITEYKNGAYLASIGGAYVTRGNPARTQRVERGTYQGVAYEDLWPVINGGTSYNRGTLNAALYPRNWGAQAFSIQYIGEGNAASIENDGTTLTLKVDGVSQTYTLASYANMSELFDALSQRTDFRLQAIALDQRTCDELITFYEVQLKTTVHTGISGSAIVESIDAAPLYIHYALDEKWHQAELFKIGSKIYSVVDGNVLQYDAVNDNTLILGNFIGGGTSPVIFRDLEICCYGPRDAEFVNGFAISEVNPYIAVFECHGMTDAPTYEVTPAMSEDGMSSLTPDTMEYFFDYMEKKGYKPVSPSEIAEYYLGGKSLPKRCYTMIFDDERWDVCLDLDFRSVFSRHGAKPGLAMITSGSTPIVHNGQTITKEKAVAIVKNAGWELLTHTKNHRYSYSILPSEYLQYFREDIYDADDKGVNGSIFVYPGGQKNAYMYEVMEFLGYKLGVDIYHNLDTTNISHSRFSISRINIGRLIEADGTSLSPYTDYLDHLV